jgi:hypothetical protein
MAEATGYSFAAFNSEISERGSKLYIAVRRRLIQLGYTESRLAAEPHGSLRCRTAHATLRKT